MISLTEYCLFEGAQEKKPRRISNRYIPVENHVQFLKNMVPYGSVVIRPTEDRTGFEVMSSRFGESGIIGDWLGMNVNGGSPVCTMSVEDYAERNGFDIWIRTVSPSDIRIVFWPADIKSYPWKEDSELYL